jgi:8-oxo-dGTP pyrophosphatase MutT (NUDIX family)
MENQQIIDKLAFIYIKNQEILMALSKGKDTYYIPGGKRKENETDNKALSREVKEELNIDLDETSIKHYGTFIAQAHGKAEGVMVQMTCYTANFTGEIEPSSEIQDLAYYAYAQRDIVGPVDQIIFDDLKEKRIIK